MPKVAELQRVHDMQADAVRTFASLIHQLDLKDDQVFKDVINTGINLCHISPAEMADALSVSPTSISRWRSGKNLPRPLGRPTVANFIYHKSMQDIE